MAKVRLSTTIRSIRGAFGDVVFKRHGNGTIVTRRATHEGTVWSEKTQAHRTRFKSAAEYGAFVCADPDLKAEYLDIRRRKKKNTTPINAFAIGDYFKPPEVLEIDAGKYTGKAGDVITIFAEDNVGVASVEVVLMDEHGNVLEQGPAKDRGLWKYKAKTHVPDGTIVRIAATAKDRPGGTGTMEIEVEVEGCRASRPGSPNGKLVRAQRAVPFLEKGAMVRRYTRVAPDGMVRKPVQGLLLE
jgi:hypothetical protein